MSIIVGMCKPDLLSLLTSLSNDIYETEADIELTFLEKKA